MTVTTGATAKNGPRLKIPALTRLEQKGHRLGEILGVLARYGLADWLKGFRVPWIQERLQSPDGQAIAELTIEERVRRAVTELGTTFIKLGQVLSTRPDLVGPDMIRELAHLQTEVPPEPVETVRATIETELGKPIGELFTQFADAPLGSASIAQVHAAELPTGEHVVVKVQRAGIADKVMVDLDILTELAGWAEKHSSELRRYQPAAVVRQLRWSLLRELDFTLERRNIQEFAEHFAQDETVRFPNVYDELSMRHVLTMERLEGILGTDSAGLAASGVDLVEFARHGANMYLQMIFRDRFYHADPHPGNLMLLEGGVIGVLDCGMTGRLDDGLADALDEMLMAVVERDAGDLEDVISRVGFMPANTPREQLRADLANLIGDLVGQSIQELNLGRVLGAFFDIIRRYNITLPPEFTMLLRTLAELEGTSQRLSPKFSLSEVLESYYATVVRRRQSLPSLLGRLKHGYRDWQRLAQSFPRDLEDVFRRIREGTFSLHLEQRRLDPVVNRLVLGMLAAALFVSSALLWSLQAPPMIEGVSVLGGAGYALATYLSWRLLRAFKKTGEIGGKD
jgi:ubiquinone biosynthesis protein